MWLIAVIIICYLLLHVTPLLGTDWRKKAQLQSEPYMLVCSIQQKANNNALASMETLYLKYVFTDIHNRDESHKPDNVYWIY